MYQPISVYGRDSFVANRYSYKIDFRPELPPFRFYSIPFHASVKECHQKSLLYTTNAYFDHERICLP